MNASQSKDKQAVPIKPEKQKSGLARQQAFAGYLFILPSTVLYAIFIIAPVIVSIILSFSYFDLIQGGYWVGWDNYVRFFSDSRSLRIFGNTLIFTALAVTGNVTIGMILALALNRKMPQFLLYFFRLAYFLPVMIAMAFVAIVWSFFYADELGVFNYYLNLLGLPAPRWLNSSQWAMISIVIMDVWKNTGFFMIIFLAALQGVPQNILDAATMVGASSWRKFFLITLPYISPVIFFAIVYASIGALQVFESIVILTRGGPGDATRSLSILIVEEAFSSFEIGYASAISVILTILILVITTIQLLGSRRIVSEQPQ